MAVVDSGALYAAVDLDDAAHHACVAVFRQPGMQFVYPTLVIGEVSYLVERRLGPGAEAAFLRSVAPLDLEAPTPVDWVRMADLVAQYRDFPLGAVDASVTALAERLGVTTVLTLDRRHFAVIRPAHVKAFNLLPE
ncbi:MAG: PIN domain-containing protein [Chloroflexi bacterium]|nr:PIN domain-containing protein [Chloroflexota bacterium]